VKSDTKVKKTKENPHQTTITSITKTTGKVTKTTTSTYTVVGVSKKCSICKKQLGTEEYITANNKNFHTQCFKCDKCGTQMNVRRYFISKSGKEICEKCSKEK